MFDLHSRLAKVQLATIALTAASNLLLFIATLTPAWQVAQDTDIGRNIQSGLWIYCPGQSQCWYIFSDDLINYYERVDVCRFFLIGDCRKKLLRTPYFFGWHYAVLIIMSITMSLAGGAMTAIGIGMARPGLIRITTVVMDALLAFAFLLCCIGLAVFLINAEMLESRYLIGVKNTFEKQYGYSFFLACFGMSVMLFALMMATFLTSTVFFMRDVDAGTMGQAAGYDNGQHFSPTESRMSDFGALRIGNSMPPMGSGDGYNKMEPTKLFSDYRPPQQLQSVPQFFYSPSDVYRISFNSTPSNNVARSEEQGYDQGWTQLRIAETAAFLVPLLRAPSMLN
uniref:Clc-like protein 5 n=1 Tax=Globodera rostochiensis TaxID=31243 RepID=A0A914H072_GLORO